MLAPGLLVLAVMTALRPLILFVLLALPAPAVAGRGPVARPWLVQVDHLGSVLLHGPSPQSAVRRYGLSLLRARVFPGQKDDLRRWTWRHSRRGARQPQLTSLQELRKSGKPLVGIQINNLGQLLKGGSWWRPSAAQRVARHIRKAGGIPVFLPPAANPAQIDRTLASIDHLVLLGGADIAPSLYGQRQTHAVHCKIRRDRYELDLVRRALKKGLGIDGICRGMQLLNVATGGTLYQDLHRDGATRKWHRLPWGWSVPHGVTLESDSAVRRTVGKGRIRMPSFHHQGLARIGKGLRVTGRASDGLPEVVEGAGGRVRGYQFHPEKRRNRASRAIFADMVQRAGAYRVAAGR